MNKRLLIALFLSVFTSILYAQEINQVDAQGKKQGIWKKYYPSNDGLFYEGQFKDDMPVGVFKHYYEEGELKSITTYSSEIVRSEVFYPNGHLMAKGNFIDQKKDSIWTYLDSDGWLSLREGYKEGQKSGLSISYYPDASIAVEQNFNNDLENGKFTQYYPNGNKEAEGNYLSGNYNGDYTYYYESGKKMHYGEFINGKRNGMWIFYNNNGSLRTVIHYKMGIVVKEDPKNGEFIVYYDTGLPKSIYNYKKGKLDGAFVEYYMLGEKVLVAREKENSFEPDEFEEVIEGQQIKRKGIYKEGVLVGDEFFYDEKGNRMKIIEHSR